MSEITLEQAYAVIDAHHESKDAERAAEARKLIGRCFKTDDGNTLTRDKVWRCTKITGVEPNGLPSGVMIQVRLRCGDLFEFHDFSAPMQGWEEISNGELRRFAAIIPASELGVLLP